MVRLLITVMRLIARWPLPVLRGLGWGLGMLLYVLHMNVAMWCR